MLYLWMPEGDAAWRWRVAGDWQYAENWDALLQATAAENHKDVMVFFPTSKVQMLRQPMTRQQVRQLGNNGVRYLMEEYSLLPVDQLSIHHQFDADQHLNVLGVSSLDIQHYQQILNLGAWRVQALLPDFMLLPAPEAKENGQTASLLFSQQQRVLRVGEHMGYSADDLSVLLAYFPELTDITVYGDLPAADRQLLQGRPELQVTYAALPATLPLTDTQYVRHPFNVLPKSRDFQVSSYWRAVAAVFVVALVVQMLYDGVRIWRYHKVADQIAAQTVQHYKTLFPDDRSVSPANVESRFRSSLNSNKNIDMTALSLISRVGPLMQQANLSASQLQYRDNALELTVTASGLPALEALRKQMSDQGLNAKLGAVNPANGQVSGLVKVQL
jgi:general secretion pathway protein L